MTTVNLSESNHRTLKNNQLNQFSFLSGVGLLSLSCHWIITVGMAVLLVIPVGLVSAAPTVSGGKDYDIPISELNKVKKKSSQKRRTSESKKKKNEASTKDQPSDTASPVQSVEPVLPTQSVQSEPPAVSDPFPESENIKIRHTPYSFVVPGRRTVIHAVMDSKSDIREVNCTLRTNDAEEETLVKMEIVDGTRFTYTASLPGLPPESPSLRYTIVAVDALGKVTRSKEFVSPVTSSPLVPSWQSEIADDADFGRTEKGGVDELSRISK